MYFQGFCLQLIESGLSKLQDAWESHLVYILTVVLHKMAAWKVDSATSKSSWIAQLLLGQVHVIFYFYKIYSFPL